MPSAPHLNLELLHPEEGHRDPETPLDKVAVRREPERTIRVRVRRRVGDSEVITMELAGEFMGFIATIVYTSISEPLAVKFSSEYGYLHEWWRLQKAKLWPQILLHLGAGPAEVVKYASMASDAVSDSFHALMFSVIFNLNVRILTPKSDFRTQMFARIRDFTHKITSGELEMDSLDSALSSIQGNTPVLFAGESIEKQRQKTMKWLTQALVTVMSDVNH